MLSKKFTTAIVTFSTIITLAGTPSMALASTQVGQLGNGAFSNNQATVTKTNTNTAVQTNTADITNNVTTSSNTGNNHADFNTGGNSTVETGPAVNNTEILNKANKNVLVANPGCNCDNGTQVLQADNGAFSGNNANVSSTNNNQLFQTNDAEFNNTVHSNSTTGNNTANFGTNGDETIITGQAKNNTGILNAANENIAVAAGGNNSDSGILGTDVRQVGNGAFSNNNISLTKNNSNLVDQTNSASIDNDVTSNANSGDNAADFTTGGSALISTGSTWNNTALVNKANKNVVVGFNNCGCDDSFVKQGDNGAYSTSDITTSLSNNNSLFSTNLTSADNMVKSSGNSGDNSSSYSTGSVFGASDPTVLAGATYTNTSVDTTVNANIAGSNSVSMGDWQFSFGWTNPFDWMAH